MWRFSFSSSIRYFFVERSSDFSSSLSPSFSSSFRVLKYQGALEMYERATASFRRAELEEGSLAHKAVEQR
jgi:hypothetical protein